MKRIESLLKVAGMKFENLNLEFGNPLSQTSDFVPMVVKIVKCKRDISHCFAYLLQFWDRS